MRLIIFRKIIKNLLISSAICFTIKYLNDYSVETMQFFKGASKFVKPNLVTEGVEKNLILLRETEFDKIFLGRINIQEDQVKAVILNLGSDIEHDFNKLKYTNIT